MSFFYKSERIGKHGRIFIIWKIRTLKYGADRSQFAQEYTFLGRFLRKTKLDELPSLWNVIKGDLAVFGYRPEEVRTWNLYPKEIQDFLSPHKPGLMDLASIHFFAEEKILDLSTDKHQDYWEKIFPIKMALRAFYFENRGFALNFSIFCIVLKRVLKSFFQ